MDFFTGQILPLAIPYAPKQTAMCSGQTLPINQNQALFALLGITYGGDGKVSFGLPNTSGRTLSGIGTSAVLGTVLGEANHTLTLTEMPGHTHTLYASTGGTSGSTATNALPGTAGQATYGAAANLVALAADPLSNAGAGQPHNNMQPSTAINFAIVLYGIFPSRG